MNELHDREPREKSADSKKSAKQVWMRIASRMHAKSVSLHGNERGDKQCSRENRESIRGGTGGMWAQL
jgi:hypothetical protein